MDKLAKDLAEFRTKFRLDDFTLIERGGWIVSLRPGQLTLGSMVLSVASGTQDLARLTPEEGAGLAAGFGLAETLARTHFGAARINALCLMMQDPVVHFHILPRYAGPVERAGTTWRDEDWPGPPAIRPIETPETVLRTLHQEMRAAALSG